jgi:hypothetical protein
MNSLLGVETRFRGRESAFRICSGQALKSPEEILAIAFNSTRALLDAGEFIALQ